MAYTVTDLEDMVLDNLSALASELSWTNSDVENSVKYALITVVGSYDATLVADTNLISVISWAEIWALKKLYNYYLTAVDFRLGPREEKLSQIARGIENLTDAVGVINTAPIVFRDMTWTFNDFTTSGTQSWPINWFETDFDTWG